VLETAAIGADSSSVHCFPGVGSCRPQKKLAPLIARFSPNLADVVPYQIRQHKIPAAKTDSLLGTQPAVVENSEERNQSGATGLLSPHGFKKGPRLGGIDDNATVDLRGHPWRPPLDALDRVAVKQP